MTFVPVVRKVVKTVVLKRDYPVKLTSLPAKSESAESGQDEEIIINIPFENSDDAQDVIEPLEEVKEDSKSTESSTPAYPNEAALRKDVILKKLVRGFKRYYIKEFKRINIKRGRRQPITQAFIETINITCEKYLMKIFGAN
eukprot:CAMPEP_0168339544 /NCGR_PEP_ID=MMETSP0213-20121227/13517_1 /TAXON_ID=151035 /ORGANISM="Euplotes harpa, Strain FSP1.4" /LENGTH=141 /DNA_ID=CAMNT_0008345581 /DNA_START=188 /DNA_END=613 /DNA_ORIENTATION=+